MSKETPQWVAEYASEWVNTLMLTEWRIRFSTSPHPNDDTSGNTKATCTVYPNVREAVIKLHDSVPNDPDDDWKDTVLHELLHVRFGSMTDYIEKVVMPELHPAAQEVAFNGWYREMEAANEIMTQILRDFERG